MGNRRFARSVAVATCALFVVRGPGAARWVIKGAGYGHGIGMSQYGAYGYAKKGTGYRAIVKHYYSGTEVGLAASSTERVLLRPYQSTVRFKGASAACGVTLAEKKTYSAKPRKSKVILRNKRGVRLANCGKEMSATGGASVSLIGKGAYRGAIVARDSTVPGRLNAINAVDLGGLHPRVIAEESPSSWPMDALQAQALAARSMPSPPGSAATDSTTTTPAARSTAASAPRRLAPTRPTTSGEVVEYKGKVAETYFFSTSGGTRRTTSSRSWEGRRCPTCVASPTPTTVRRHITAGNASCPTARCRPSWAGWCAAS